MPWNTQRLRLAQRLHASLIEYKAAADVALQAAECERQKKEDTALLQKHIALANNVCGGIWSKAVLELALRQAQASLAPSTDTAGLAKRARQLAADAERAETNAFSDESAFMPEAGVVSWAVLSGSIAQWARELEHDPAPNPSVLSFFGTRASWCVLTPS